MSSQTKKLVILGGGSGIERYKEDIKRFDKRDDVEILTYSLSYMYCVNELGVHVDYHCFIDPVPFLPVHDYIKRNVDHMDIKTKFVFLDPLHTKCSYQDFIDFYGSTPLGRGTCPWPQRSKGPIDPDLSWRWFLEATHEVINHPRLAKTIIPTTSLKYIYNNLHLYPQFKEVDLSGDGFLTRFQGNELILKTQLNPDLNEDKLTGFVLPLAQWLFKEETSIKEVGVIGFELTGGRYMWNFDRRYMNFFAKRGFAPLCDGTPDLTFCYDNNKGLTEAEQTTRDYMKLWNENADKTKLDIHSLVEQQYSLLNKYIKYKPIQEL